MTQKLNRGVFVVDEAHSPLWRAARSHAAARNILVISANEFFSAAQMAKKISSIDPEFIIFSWRGAFDAVLSSRRARLMLRSSNVRVFLLIPDLVGIHQVSLIETQRVSMADGVLVTSEELKEKYLSVYGVENLQILHDYPPYEEIDSINLENLTRKPNQIVWVGNSRWGARSGFVDHKGLESLAFPVIEQVRKVRPDLHFILIDSAVEKMPYESVLRTIRESACLIFTSSSEGTGLPLIESASLGTPVVAVRVGVAPEILKGDLARFLTSRDIRIFSNEVLEILSDVERYSELVLTAGIKYREKISLDFDALKLSKYSDGRWRVHGMPRSFSQHLKWKYRWLSYLRTRFLIS